MDILIKGLALPKKGTTELTIYEDGHVLYEQDDGQYIEMGDAKAIELPPHGRLILDTDVKALLRSGLSLDTDSDKDYVCGLIDGLPPILEAST